jgi:putative DNA primase/helicase
VTGTDEDAKRDDAYRKLQAIFRTIRHKNTPEGEREAAKQGAKRLMEKYGFDEPPKEEPSGRNGRGSTSGTEPVIPGPDEPLKVARQFVADRYTHTDKATLMMRHWRGGWWRWRTTHWSEAEEAAVRSQVYRYTEDALYIKMIFGDPNLVPWSPSRYKVANVLDALKAVGHLQEDTAQPGWVDGPPSAPEQVVSCKNGLLDVMTRRLYEHDPRYFNQVSVPFDYEAEALKPKRWLEFLDQLWPDDHEGVAALQEFFGYAVSGRTDLHKIMLLIGPTRAGKGVIARVLTAMLGRANVTGPTLASLGTNFGLQDLIGKPLAIISDARLGGANTHQVVERLLSISGEDTLTIDRKYRDPWTGQLPTRFLVISNELPNFGDASGAIANRFVILTLQTSWLGKENPALTKELTAELPGILNWALEGLERLTENNRFTEPKSSVDAVLALADIVSPVAAFVRDCCARGALLEVSCDDLYRRWKAWAEDNGQKPGSTQMFGRNLRAVVPGLGVRRPRDGEGRVRYFVGVAPTPANNG